MHTKINSHRIKQLATGMFACLALVQTASAQYQGWRHVGALYILTTPEGANLPATASEENFPLLVRLSKEWFDFSQAKGRGEDIRFSASGQSLAYQVEEWDAAKGTASIWVKIPVIKGNAHQELHMHWGKADAASESSGAAVFSTANGYVSVWHMSDPVTDEVGTLPSQDAGTTATTGMVGPARHFPGQKGVFCGDKIPNLPSGAGSHSTEAWFRAEKPNVTLVGWGNEGGGRGSKVRMQLRSPPHLHIDSDFSDVDGAGKLPMSEWIYVAHTYSKGDGKIYINGQLDGADHPVLDIKTPARLWLGGWYNNYDFVGDLDEVRLSNVARSADWVKLQYENQKPMQTLVGLLVKPGSACSVSEKRLTVFEGKRVTISAEAGGAQKIYWLLKAAGKETVVGVDALSFTFEAGRVTGDTSVTLQLKAVYANEVKVNDIQLTVKEDIPEPVFTLRAPAKWDGRTTIEVVPQISNLAAMQAKGAGELNCSWRVSGLAVIKQEAPGKLILTHAQNSGNMVVTATVNNGGQAVTQSALIKVTEPKSDAWVQRVPAKDEKPEDGQFYARDDKNEGTLFYHGTLNEAAGSVFLKLYADGKLVKTESATPAADKAYAFAMKLKPGLIQYKVEFGTKVGGQEKVLQTVNNIACGDAYLIDGQSNALATDTGENAPPETNEWIRSYGSPSGNAKDAPGNLWCNPVWKARHGEKAELGWWGMELAKRLLESQKVPIFIINAAAGGTRIDQHQKSAADPADLTTLYGRMLWRVRQAKLTHGIRGILWHQGENDQGADGPTGGYGWETYQQLFVEMSAAWKQDFPNVRHYYVFQIWPNSCSMGGGQGSGDMLREKQRTLPRLYSNMSIMSTLGIRPPGGCHYPLAGWAEFARLIQPLIERDNTGKVPAASVTPPNLQHASYANETKDAITLEFDQPVVWADALAGQFYLDGEKGKVASGSVSGNSLVLKLKEPSAARQITYLKEIAWSQDTLLNGANGIAALTFCNVPLVDQAPSR